MSPPISKIAKVGRTTRMLEHAKQLARQGKEVYVVADSVDEVRRMEVACGEPKLGIVFKVVNPFFDWEEMKFPGSPHGSVILVDHHTIEDKFRVMIKMLHAYDEPRPVTYFKFWAKGKTADGNILKTEGHVSIETEGTDSLPPQEAFDKCAEFLEKEFPTVKFIEGETTLKRLKKKPK